EVAWSEVLKRDPGNGTALRALARLQRNAGDWAALVETLRRSAEARTDPRARADALFSVATVQLDRLGDAAGGRQTLEAVLRLAGDHLPALRELERLTPDATTPDFLETLERATLAGTDEERLTARLRLAHALAQAGQLERAAALAEAALETDPGHLGALVLLEHTRAADPSRPADVPQ